MSFMVLFDMISLKTKICLRRCFLACVFFVTTQSVIAQTYLGHNREEVLLSFPECQVVDKYETRVVLNCNGQRSLFYFQGEHKLCDLFATEMETASANDTLAKLSSNGFKLLDTRYVEPFLVSKHNNHQKFPAKVYTNGKLEYCFMPISLTGRTAELSSVIIRYHK